MGVKGIIDLTLGEYCVKQLGRKITFCKQRMIWWIFIEGRLLYIHGGDRIDTCETPKTSPQLSYLSPV